MSSLNTSIVWCDIPVVDLDRAITFYSAVLNDKVHKDEIPGFVFAILPHGEGGVGACLYTSDRDKPSVAGPLVYFNCNGRLDDAIAAVEANGGRIIHPKQDIGPHGFRAVVLDSEGNRIALQSM